MRVSQTSVCIVISLSVAWFLGTVLTVLIIDSNNLKDNHPHNFNGPYPSDIYEHVIWFIQVSDLHLSRYNDPGRSEDLFYWCEHTINAIKPAVVLATGDLTDAKTKDQQGSQQWLDEWQTYYRVLQLTKVINKTVWLDVRGNHDAFDIPNWNSDQNFYREYSVQGHKNLLSYHYQLQSGNDKYSFIAVDACLDPGPKRPFNFFGIINDDTLTQLNKYAEESLSSNMTIWFGHYPTSTIMSAKTGLRDVMWNGAVYLCGHFHTIGGLVHQMYTRQQTGNLELELADWKDNRMFRVAAIDHELFSFVDVPLKQWPIIIITNPKHALYVIPHHEPLIRMKNSSHIRLLIFSPSRVTSVKVQIDSSSWKEAFLIQEPLYVLPWNPHLYSVGIHTITVEAWDSEHNHQTVSQPFSLDGTRLDFKLITKLLLMTNLSLPMQIIFGLLLILNIVPLCILRLGFIKISESRGHCFLIRYMLIWLKRLYILSCIDQLFYPLIFSALYVALGPWFVGEIINGYYGLCFVYGLYVNKKFLPGTLTYTFGLFHFITFHIPLTLCLARCCHLRYKNFQRSTNISLLRYLFRHLFIILIILYQAWCAYTFFLNYGTMAFFLGPVRTWSILMAIVLWRIASTLPEYSFAMYQSRMNRYV